MISFRYKRKFLFEKSLNDLLHGFTTSHRLVRIWVYTFVTFRRSPYRLEA